MSVEFPIKHLSVLAYAQGFTLWHYKGSSCGMVMADLASQAWQDFLSSFTGFHPGDHLHLSCLDGGALLYLKPDGFTIMARS